MKQFLYIVLLTMVTNVHAQYFEAKLLMETGEVKSGYARLPSNGLLDGAVEFKATEKGKKEKIKDEEIKQMLVTSEKGNKFLFERAASVHLFKSFGKEYRKEKAEKHWMLMIHYNDALNVYSMAQRYRLNKKGVMISIVDSNSFWSTIYFLYRKPDQEKAYIVSGKGFSNGMVRKAMAIYFEDSPGFVERINDKEFKKEGVRKVADEFEKSLQ